MGEPRPAPSLLIQNCRIFQLNRDSSISSGGSGGWNESMKKTLTNLEIKYKTLKLPIQELASDMIPLQIYCTMTLHIDNFKKKSLRMNAVVCECVCVCVMMMMMKEQIRHFDGN
jgi:hypothetical protein